MPKTTEAFFLSGPGIPENHYLDIVKEAAEFGLICQKRRLRVVFDFPAWELWNTHCNFHPDAWVGKEEKRRHATLLGRFLFQFHWADELYVFAAARTHSQKKWINTIFNSICGQDIKVFLHLY